MSKAVVVSGGFDPLHEGHINLFRAARALGDTLIVIVEHDAFVRRKHQPLMSQEERAAVVRGVACVNVTIRNPEESGDCSGILSTVRPSIFAVGPDHEDVTKLPEWKICAQLGINVVCLNSLPKGNRTSSTPIIESLSKPKWNNPPVAVGVLMVDKNAILIGRAPNKKWELPGGFLEAGETLEYCARREVFEEIGITIRSPLRYFNSVCALYHDARPVTAAYFFCEILESPKVTNEMGIFSWVRGARDYAITHNQIGWEGMHDQLIMDLEPWKSL